MVQRYLFFSPYFYSTSFVLINNFETPNPHVNLKVDSVDLYCASL